MCPVFSNSVFFVFFAFLCSDTMPQVKYCFVPSCNNRGDILPNKIFVSLPQNPTKRKMWFKAVNLSTSDQKFSQTHLYCCEDHFEFERDASNWIYFRTMGANIKLKPEVVPHKCLTPSKKPSSEESQLTPSSKKRKTENIKSLAAGSRAADQGQQQQQQQQQYAARSGPVRRLFIPEMEASPVTPLLSSPPPTTWTQSEVTSPSGTFNISIVCANKEIKCGVPVESIGVNTTLSLINQQEEEVSHTSSSDERSEENGGTSGSSEEFVPSTSSGETSTSGSTGTEPPREPPKQPNFVSINKRPLFYLGVPMDTYFLVKLCASKGHITEFDVLLTLKKIRLDDQYVRLADDFCISTSYAGKIFIKTVPILAGLMQELVTWPSSMEIKRSLPVAFRARYQNVESIIDCFEISIEKPSNPLNQALTWSEYKKANTIKYLVSATPNGEVNFISGGFGGRTTDTTIFEKSGFLEKLPNNVSVMADRGFKHVAHLLEQKGCTLVRPPSVSGDEILSKEEVKVGKIIASLRIHIERVIGRFREFKMLDPHSTVDHNLLYIMDHVVTIVSGIVNVHGPLIK